MRIACPLAQGFEDSEFRVPYDRFRAAGHEVVVIGLDKKKLEGKNKKESVTPDQTFDDVDASEFDALFIPGGHSPDQLRGEDKVVSFVKAFADKPIFAICHGPQLLITADMVRGRTMTAWKTVQVDLKNAGAKVKDEAFVVDDRLVTSRQPQDLDDFVRRSLEIIANGAAAHL